MALKKQNKISLSVDPFNTDFSRRWSWMALGRTLLNAAEIHAKARGFGMSNVNSENYTWVLSRLCIEMDEMPSVWETVNVNTWIENIYRLFTNRDFSIKSPEGKVYGYARSIWALIDYNTRQPVNLEELHGDNFAIYLDSNEPCPIEPQGRVRPIEDSYWVRDLKAEYTDIDQNGHVNSIKYIEHILNLFPLSRFQGKHKLKRVELAYMAESYFGDMLSIYKRKVDENTYEVEVRKKIKAETQRTTSTENIKKDEPLVRCKLVFV